MLSDKFFVIAQVGHEATLFILVILSIFSIAFIFERYFTLTKVLQKSIETSKKIQSALQSNNLNQVEDIAKDNDSLESRGLSYGVRHVKAHGAHGLDELFSSYALIEKPELEKRLSFLATVGSNAPFIGLLGTVFGIMDAFRGLATSTGEIQAVLNGISSALVATAVGLIVAIPAVIAYNFFQKRVKRIMQSFDSARDLCVAYAKSTKGGH